MEFEIDGVKYREKPQPKINRGSRSQLISLMPFALMAPIYSGGKKSRPRVNLIEEYKLIQQKKSRLSANNRAWVVAQFKRKYEPVVV